MYENTQIYHLDKFNRKRVNLRMRCKAHGDMKSRLQRTDNVDSSINTGDLSNHHKEQKKASSVSCRPGKNTIPLSIGATIQQYNRKRRVWWECSALFPCAPNGSKQGRLGLRHMQKKVQFRVRNDHWIKAPKMTFNRVNPRHYKLQLEEELFTTMAIFFFFLLLLLFVNIFL